MAKYIPKEFIEQINARTNLVTLIGGRVPLKKSGNSYKACCPFHDEKTPSFVVSESGQFYHCFGCGAAGDAIRFLMDFDNLTFQESVESLAQLHGMSIPYDHKDKVEVEKEHSLYNQGLACLADAAQFFHEQLYNDGGHLARQYLRERRLKKNTLNHFKLGYAPHGNVLLNKLQKKYPLSILQAVGLIGEKDGQHYDWFRHRIIFPIHNVKGQIVAFGARAFGDEQPKYLNSSESKWFNKRYELYGLHQALQAKKYGKVLLVTEGYMDVIKLWQSGIYNSVAALGTAIGETHISQLKKRADKVYFSFDGDQAGEKAAKKALEAIFRQYDEQHQWRFMFMPSGEDPDSLIEHHGIEAFHHVMDGALRPSGFLIRLLEETFGNTRSVEANAQLVQQAQSWLGYLSDDTYKYLLRDALVEYFKLPDISLSRAKPSYKSTKAKYESFAQAQKPLAMSSVEEKLIAYVYTYPLWALTQFPWQYAEGVFEALPIFWQLCYHLQYSEASVEKAGIFIKDKGMLEQIQSLSLYYQQIPEKNGLQEFTDMLSKLSAREDEKRKRLEKLGS